MAPILLLSGTRGTGKTNLCAAVAQRAKSLGWDVSGLLSPGVFIDGRKAEIDVQDLRSLERRHLARQRPSWQEPPEHSVYTRSWNFSSDGLNWANERLLQSTPCDLLIIDELGSLEFERGTGWQAAFDVLDEGKFRLAVVVVREEQLEAARQRWPQAREWACEAFCSERADAFASLVLALLNGEPTAG